MKEEGKNVNATVREVSTRRVHTVPVPGTGLTG